MVDHNATVEIELVGGPLTDEEIGPVLDALGPYSGTLALGEDRIDSIVTVQAENLADAHQRAVSAVTGALGVRAGEVTWLEVMTTEEFDRREAG